MILDFVCAFGSLSVVSNALRPREDAVITPLAKDGEESAPFTVASFYAERVALHRPSYRSEKNSV